tara:strand:+ start:124 stop:639 length:516 start_codon:yes stop_codon:yes gene_type:complete
MKQNQFLSLLLFLGILLIINQNHQNSEQNKKIIIIHTSEEEDDDDDVPKEPRRYHDSRYHTRRRMRVNVPTRGEPPAYQQVGILTDTDNAENIKPLYGRQTYRGSNQWNYFTSLDSHLATKIPVQLSDHDCTDERGCKEIYKGDLLNIGDPGNEYKVNIYQTHAPRYIPYL